MKTKHLILLVFFVLVVGNSQGQTALEKALATMNVSLNLPSFLTVSQNMEIEYPVSEGEFPTIAQAYDLSPSSGSTLIKALFGKTHAVIMHQDGECQIIVSATGENTLKYGTFIKNNSKFFGYNNSSFNIIRKDFRYSDPMNVPSEKDIEELDMMLTHYPKEQAQKMFNADWMVMYPRSLRGGVFRDKYTRCRSVIISKNGLDIVCYFMLTDKGSENFNSYLNDLNHVFWFQDNK